MPARGVQQGGSPDSQDKGSSPQQTHAAYLSAGDKVLVSRGNLLKLVSRDAGSRTDFFQDPASTYFGNRITSGKDEVRLFVTPQQLRQLLTTLDWAQVQDQTFVLELLHALKASFDGRSVRVPFTIALLAVQSLTKAAIEQVDFIEQQARTFAAAELSLIDVPKKEEHESRRDQLNIIDSHQVLHVLSSLEDQLH